MTTVDRTQRVARLLLSSGIPTAQVVGFLGADVGLLGARCVSASQRRDDSNPPGAVAPSAIRPTRRLEAA